MMKPHRGRPLLALRRRWRADEVFLRGGEIRGEVVEQRADLHRHGGRAGAHDPAA